MKFLFNPSFIRPLPSRYSRLRAYTPFAPLTTTAQMSASPSSHGTPYTIPPDTLAEFQSNGWTGSLLASRDYTAIETVSRSSKSGSGEDAFFAETLGSSTTIPHLLTLRVNKPVSPPKLPPPQPAPPAMPPTPKNNPELISLLRLGKPGVSGHPDTAHGGAVATILDEVMSLAVMVQIPGYEDVPNAERGRIFTSQLDVRFLRPVFVPAACVVKAWVTARDGKKFWLRGKLIQEDGLGGKEGEGMGGSIEAVKRKRVCADAVGFWVVKTPEKL